MNDKSLEERTIYDGPKNNERVNVTKALERLYGCILNKKKDKMKFFVRYEKKTTLSHPCDDSPCYYADLFVYKETFKGKFAQLEISKLKLWELEKLGINTLLPSEKRYRYKYGKVLMDGYMGPEDPMQLFNYVSNITIKNVEFTLKRAPFETNAEIKERETKKRLEEIRQGREEEERTLYEICCGIRHRSD